MVRDNGDEGNGKDTEEEPRIKRRDRGQKRMKGEIREREVRHWKTKIKGR